MSATFPGKPITLCGFSFGARVGLEVGIADDRVKDLISIGTPVNKYDFAFLEACRKPILFVHGADDEYGDLDRVRILVEKLKLQTQAELVVVNDCGHFFEGHLDELKSAITNWKKTIH